MDFNFKKYDDDALARGREEEIEEIPQRDWQRETFLDPIDVKRGRQRNALEEAIGPELTLLLRDQAVREIDVNDNGSVFVERVGEGGGTLDTGLEFSPIRARQLVMNIAAAIALQDPGIILDEINQSLDGKLGWSENEFVRVSLTAPPGVEQHTVEIRKHSSIVIPLADHVGKIMTQEQYNGICQLIDERANIVIVGEMFSGKTTLGNGILERIGRIDPARRYGYIEDVRELVVPLKNKKGILATREWPISRWMDRIVRWNLKSISISELRNGIAANHLMNDLWLQGHDGGLTTFHAGSWKKFMWRTEQLIEVEGFRAKRELLAAAIGGVIVIKFSHAHGRKVTGVYRMHDELDDGEYGVDLLGQEVPFGD